MTSRSTTPDVILHAADVPSTPFPIPGTTPPDGVTAKLLNGDPALVPTTAIIEIRGGTTIPAHYHAQTSELHYVLSGDFINNGVSYGPGAFFAHAAGTVHGPHSSHGGCAILTVQPAQVDAGDFHIVQDR